MNKYKRNNFLQLRGVCAYRLNVLISGWIEIKKSCSEREQIAT